MTQHIPWKQTCLRLLVVATVATVIVSASAGFAVAVPTPPHEVFGTVEDQSGDAVAGLTVQVVHGGTVIDTATTNSDGYYEIKVSDESLTEGDTLTVQVKDESETTPYSPGSSERIDFTVQRATTTTTTSNGGDDGGGNPPAGGGGGNPPAGGGGGGTGDTGTTTTVTTETTTTTTTTETTETTTTTEKAVQETTTSVTETGEPPADTEPDETETTTTTDDGGLFGNIPGFGVSVTIVALVTAALLVIRRSN